MSSSKYNVKWKDYRDAVSSSFGSLRKDTELCDLTLVSEDEEPVLAHKVVLSTGSKFFEGLLCKLPGSNAVAYLGGVKTRHLHNVLDYIYLGEVNIEDEDVDIFIEQAKKLKLRGFEIQKDSGNMHENSGLIRPKEEDLEVVENVLEASSTISKIAIDDEIVDENTMIHQESQINDNEALCESYSNGMNNLRNEYSTGYDHQADQQIHLKLEDDNCFDSDESFDLDENLEDLLTDNENMV